MFFERSPPVWYLLPFRTLNAFKRQKSLQKRAVLRFPRISSPQYSHFFIAITPFLIKHFETVNISKYLLVCNISVVFLKRNGTELLFCRSALPFFVFFGLFSAYFFPYALKCCKSTLCEVINNLNALACLRAELVNCLSNGKSIFCNPHQHWATAFFFFANYEFSNTNYEFSNTF